MTARTPRARSIVIVEDETVLANLLGRRLEEAGYRVSIATDGAAGLADIRAKHPDLVLLDMLLPKMNGMDIIRALAKGGVLPALPVIIISNSGQPVELEEARRLGVRDYLIKLNFSPDEVLERVNEYFRAREEGGGAAHKRPERPARGRGRGVLVIEDDTLLGKLLTAKLAERGYRALLANHVTAARAVLEKDNVDLILLDLILPEIDGYTFLKELKASPSFRDIPVIIVSNLGQDEEIQRGLRTGALDYIVKATMSPADIVAKLESHMSRR